MTLAEVLHSGAARLRTEGVADRELEAELLLRHALGLSREEFLARLREPVGRDVGRKFEALLQRRLRREPVAYITGRCEFYGLELECSRAALIPRPETEILVELAVDWARGQGPRAKSTVADVGTGNGAIAVAIAVHAPRARVIAIDVSRDALALARRNATAHGVAGRIDLVQGSLLSMLRAPVDVIVANLPYIPTRLYRKLPLELLDHEPEVALHAGRRGTALIEALIAQAPALLRRRGLLVAEHQWNQGRRLREAAQVTFPGARIETRRDLTERERVLVVENT